MALRGANPSCSTATVGVSTATQRPATYIARARYMGAHFVGCETNPESLTNRDTDICVRRQEDSLRRRAE